MSDFREQHHGAVLNAIEQVALLQERLSIVSEQCDVASGNIITCVGATDVESGAAALNIIQGIKYDINEIFGKCNNAISELERYGRGF